MFPARDGLIRVFSGRTAPLPALPFYVVSFSQPSLCLRLFRYAAVNERRTCSHSLQTFHIEYLNMSCKNLIEAIDALQVTYGICIGVYLVSIVTPSIWGPIQIIGATAGAVIGFIIPGQCCTIATKMYTEVCLIAFCKHHLILYSNLKGHKSMLLLGRKEPY